MEQAPTTPRTCRVPREMRDTAADLAQQLADARVHVASAYYRSCFRCHVLFAPVFAHERYCPDCVALRNQVAHGPAPLPS